VALTLQVGRKLSELLRQPEQKFRARGATAVPSMGSVLGFGDFHAAASDFNTAALELIAVRSRDQRSALLFCSRLLPFCFPLLPFCFLRLHFASRSFGFLCSALV
jgi:hypothetical protein